MSKKKNLIFKVTSEERKILELKLAMTLGRIGLFDDFIKEEEKQKKSSYKTTLKFPQTTNK